MKPEGLLQFVAASQRECFCIGQFARLLPTLVVVAISQAPSPESNPDSLSPVKATVVHYTTVVADRSEVLSDQAFPHLGISAHPGVEAEVSQRWGPRDFASPV